MKKKLFKATTLFLALCTFVLSACDNKPVLKDNLEDVLNNEETADNTTDGNGYNGFYGYGATLKERPTEYNGGELSVKFSMNNNGDAIDYGFLVYVNGIQNEFRIDDNDEYASLHSYYFEKGESKNITLNLVPYNCKKGDTAEIRIAVMLAPSYKLKDASYISYGRFHSVMSIGHPLQVKINEDTPETDFGGIYTEVSKTEITDEFREEYISRDPMDPSVIVNDTLKNMATYELYLKDPLDSFFPCEDSLELTFRAFGLPKKFMAAIYVDHEIVPAFDGKKYALFDVDEGKTISQTKVTINTSKLDDTVHSIYMIAIPLGDTSAIDKNFSILLLRDEELINQAEEAYKAGLENRDNDDNNTTPDDTKKESAVIGLSTNSILNITKLDESTLLAECMTDFQLYDVEEDKSIKTIERKNGFTNIQLIDNGFVIINNNGEERFLEIYGTKGNLIKHVDILNQFGRCGGLVVSNDGKCVVYCNLEGVYTDSIDSDDKIQIESVNDTDREYTLAVPYVYDGEDIYCYAMNTKDPNKRYFASYSTTANEMTLYCDFNNPKRLSSRIYKNAFAISEPAQSHIDKSDEIYYMVIGDSEASVLTCEDPHDNEQAYISENGKYIATVAEYKHVKVYDTETSEVIWEITMPHDANEICVDEVARKIYIVSQVKIWVYEF